MGRIANAVAALRGKPKAQSFDLTSMTGEQLQDFLRIGGSMQTATGVSVSENSAMRVGAAWRAVNIIAGTVGSLPRDLVKRISERERQPAIGHPLRRVLTVKPNQWQTPAEFFRLMQAHMLLRGNAYALKVTAAGRLLALIPLHPDRVTVKQRDDMSLSYVVTRKDGRKEHFTGADIFHLRGLSLDGVTGLSVLSHMRESLGLALSAEKASARLMKNGSFVSGTLEHPGKLSPEAYERLKESNEQYAGSDSAGKTRILEEGMSWNPVGMSAKDSQFLEQRDFQRYDIAMFFGVPPHMLGVTEKTTSWGSGIEQQGIGFVTYTLNDWLKIWEEAIKRDLIAEREWDTLDMRFFTQGLMRGDVKTRQGFYQSGLQWGWLSPDEVRALEDMNPRPDDEGAIYYDPPNTAGGQSEGEGDEPPKTP